MLQGFFHSVNLFWAVFSSVAAFFTIVFIYEAEKTASSPRKALHRFGKWKAALPVLQLDAGLARHHCQRSCLMPGRITLSTRKLFLGSSVPFGQTIALLRRPPYQPGFFSGGRCYPNPREQCEPCWNTPPGLRTQLFGGGPVPLKAELFEAFSRINCSGSIVDNCRQLSGSIVFEEMSTFVKPYKQSSQAPN